MKTPKTLIALLLIIIVFSAGCKKDDNPGDSSNNKYVYQGTETKITEGSFFNNSVLGNNTLTMILSGEESSSKWIEIFFFKSQTTIQEGTFTYKDNASNSYDPLTSFSGGDINLDLETSHEITGGKVQVSKSGNNYIVTIDVSTTRGPITGKYTGTLVEKY